MWGIYEVATQQYKIEKVCSAHLTTITFQCMSEFIFANTIYYIIQYTYITII